MQVVRRYVSPEIVWGHELWARAAVALCLRLFGSPSPAFGADVRMGCCCFTEQLSLAPMGVVFSTVLGVFIVVCNSYGFVLHWWGCTWIRLGVCLSRMVFGTFFRFLTSLAHGGVMSRLVSMGKVGVCSYVVLNLMAGEKGPNGEEGNALWSHPIAMEMW